MFDVLCVGILVADAIAKPVPTLPGKGKLALTEHISLHTGGCATTAAINLAKLGRRPAIAGKIGDDGFGRFLASELEAAGVHTEALVADPAASTSASLVIVAPDGERSFIHSLGANGEFAEKDIDYGVVARSNIVFVAGTMLMPSFDGADCAKFLQKCKEMGKITALDTAWDAQGRWMSVLAPSMPYLDYFLPSLEEARELSGENDPDHMANVFLSMGPHTVVIKLGKDGCLIRTKKGERYHIPTFDRIQAVDTTGAGDSFCAGFLTGLTHGWDLPTCGRFANAVGTHCVMAIGASTGIRSETEILQFIKDYDQQPPTFAL
jgi:sugar/nucleoside kinase (ribokinase family)